MKTWIKTKLPFAVALLAALAWSRESVPATALAPGQTVDLLLDSAHPATLVLNLDNARSAQLLVNQDEPSLIVRALSGGREVASLQSGYPGWLLFSFPLSSGSQYSLTLEAPKALAPVKISVTLRPAPESAANIDFAIEAEKIFAAAQALRPELTAAALHQAIALYRQAGRLWFAGKNQTGQALALMAEAETWRQLCRYQTALRAYAMAQPFVPPETALEVSRLNGQARAYLDWWKGTEALRLSEEALRLSRRLRDRTGEARALANRGEAKYLFSTGPDASESDLRDALALSQAEHNRVALAHILRVRSWTRGRDSGHLAEGSAMMRAADELFRQTGDLRNSLWELCDIANDDTMAGDSYSALVRHLTAIRLFHDAGDIDNEGSAAAAVGLDYQALNRPREALDYFLEAGRLFAAEDHTGNRQSTIILICETELSLNRLADAATHCRAAKRIAPGYQTAYFAGEADRHLGQLAEARHQWNQAFEYYRQAAKLDAKAQYPLGQASAVLGMGLSKQQLAGPAAALAFFKQALAISQQAQDPAGVIDARYQTARAQAQLGQIASAQSELDQALEIFEAQRLKVQDDKLKTSYFAAARKCYDLYVSLLMTRHRQQPAAGFDLLALEKSEAARARTLLDSLALRDAAPQKKENAELSRLHAALSAAYETRLNLIVRGKSEPEIQRNAAEIRRLASEYDRAQDIARDQTHPPQTPVRPLSAQELLGLSAAGDALILEYSLGEKQSYLFRLEQGKLTTATLPPRQTIAAAVEKWRALLAARQRRPGETFSAYRLRVQAADRALPGQSAALSCMLLPGLPAGPAERLVIVADGVLQSVPFAALPLNGCAQSPGAPLLTAYETVNAPSLSVLQAGAKTDRAAVSFKGDVAILADPVFSAADPRVAHRPAAAKSTASVSPLQSALRDVGYARELPRLAATRQEAAAVAAAVPGAKVLLATDFEASLANAISPEIAQYRILHFATHGLLDSKSPDLSGLVFSLVDAEGHPTPGYLKTQDIFDLSLKADLVVLSACSSGLGEQIDGEGTIGLSYAFLRAGARQVVSTLWNIDDQASSDLMAEFYRRLLADHLTPPAALRRAQQSMLAQKHSAAPFFWASYILTSN